MGIILVSVNSIFMLIKLLIKNMGKWEMISSLMRLVYCLLLFIVSIREVIRVELLIFSIFVKIFVEINCLWVSFFSSGWFK